jgi:dienelactone hydrolase
MGSKSINEKRDISFKSDGLTIRGTLISPQGSGSFPLVILGHGIAALKEWTLPEVAEALVEVGIAGMYFDYRNMGDSEGEPRDEVAHYGRIEDWHNAISFATTLPNVDATNIGIWGTSLGGRDVLAVASTERRIKAVVAQTPLITWNAALASKMSGFGSDVDRYYQELDEDRKKRALGKEPQYLPFAKEGETVKIDFINSLKPTDLRNHNNRVTLQSYRPTALVDITQVVPLIAPTPVLFILATEDFLPGQRGAYEAAKEPKSLVMLEGNHFSPYMTAKEESIKATKEWFVKHLK